MELKLNKANSMPLYGQIYHQVRRMILRGQLEPGTRLPASRQMARRNSVARVTVVQAYEQLEAEGYVISLRGSGTYVSQGLPLQTPAVPFSPSLSPWGDRVMAAGEELEPGQKTRPSIDFGFGRSFPHIFPYDIWRRLLARYLSTDDVMLSRYGSAAGFNPLRQALAEYLERMRGVHCTPEQVVIVSGAQQALDILARLVLVPGDEVLVETPGYAAAFELFRLHGARIRALPVDEKGLPVDRIPADSKARLAFVTPTNQFPRGGTMPLSRRLALLGWAQERDVLLVEDDYDGELRYTGHPISALQGLDESNHVVYLGTFSKVLFPALRLGYVVLPSPLIAPFVQAKGLVDRGAPTLTQAAVADFIIEGHFERHLNHLRQAYGQRRRVLVHALERELPGKLQFADVEAGLHVMLYLHPDCDEAALVRKAAAAGVGVYPGAPYHLQEPIPPSILLGFSGLNEPEIEEGVRRLAAVIH